MIYFKVGYYVYVLLVGILMELMLVGCVVLIGEKGQFEIIIIVMIGYLFFDEVLEKIVVSKKIKVVDIWVQIFVYILKFMLCVGEVLCDCGIVMVEELKILFVFIVWCYCECDLCLEEQFVVWLCDVIVVGKGLVSECMVVLIVIVYYISLLVILLIKQEFKIYKEWIEVISNGDGMVSLIKKVIEVVQVVVMIVIMVVMFVVVVVLQLCLVRFFWLIY